jgi:hypothetical protein
VLGAALPGQARLQLATLLQDTWHGPPHETVQSDTLVHVTTLPAPAMIPHVGALLHVALQDAPQINSQVETLSHSKVHPVPHEAVQCGALEHIDLQPLLQTNPQTSPMLSQVCLQPSPLHPRSHSVPPLHEQS